MDDQCTDGVSDERFRTVRTDEESYNLPYRRGHRRISGSTSRCEGFCFCVAESIQSPFLYRTREYDHGFGCQSGGDVCDGICSADHFWQDRPDGFCIAEKGIESGVGYWKINGPEQGQI